MFENVVGHITLGSLTAIDGFVDIGDLVTNALAGAGARHAGPRVEGSPV